jgi:NhaP-type Na+/H+ or K+/H+ antiporter
METSIFAYLGLFLFSNKKWGDIPMILIGTLSCVLSRMVMIGITSVIVNGGIMMKSYIQNFFRTVYHQVSYTDDESMENQQQSRFNHNRDQEAFVIDRNMQLVLLYSGVRGAVSLALAENIPIYDAVTKTGSSFKPVLRTMTSSSIIFTVFFFGASTYFTLKRQRERLNNSTTLDAEFQQRGGLIGGILNSAIFGFDYNRHDLSLHENTVSTGSLTVSLLTRDAATSHEERHLPPWMRS